MNLAGKTLFVCWDAKKTFDHNHDPDPIINKVADVRNRVSF